MALIEHKIAAKKRDKATQRTTVQVTSLLFRSYVLCAYCSVLQDVIKVISTMLARGKIPGKRARTVPNLLSGLSEEDLATLKATFQEFAEVFPVWFRSAVSCSVRRCIECY